MPTFEYKYEKGRTVYWATEGVPQSESEIITKIAKCTIDKMSFVQDGAYQFIKYDVRGVWGIVSVCEEFLFESEEDAYKQIYKRISEQIEVDQEKIDNLKKLRTICINKW